MAVVPAVRPGARRGVALLVVLLTGITMLAACSGSGYTFVSSSDDRAYFKVPTSWHAFDKRTILDDTGQADSGLSNSELSFVAAYDADPSSPALAHVLSLAEAPAYPVAYARAQTLGFADRDKMSLESMRNSVYPVDQLLQNDGAEILSYDDVILDGGLHGIHIVYDVLPKGVGAITTDNPVIRVNQTGVVDPATKTYYLFVVRCSAACYQSNQSLIGQIVDSWTVKER